MAKNYKVFVETCIHQGEMAEHFELEEIGSDDKDMIAILMADGTVANDLTFYHVPNSSREVMFIHNATSKKDAADKAKLVINDYIQQHEDKIASLLWVQENLGIEAMKGD